MSSHQYELTIPGPRLAGGVPQDDHALVHTLRFPYESGRKLWFIGDGQLRQLDALLMSIDFDQARDHLVFLGDLITKGPDSEGVCDRVRKLCEQGLAHCVQGNHDFEVEFNKAVKNQASIDFLEALPQVLHNVTRIHSGAGAGGGTLCATCFEVAEEGGLRRTNISVPAPTVKRAAVPRRNVEFKTYCVPTKEANDSVKVAWTVAIFLHFLFCPLD